MRRLTLSFLLLISALFVAGQKEVQAQLPELINDQEFRPAAQAAVDSIYNFNFKGADEILSPWEEQYPDHPLWMLIDGMQLWWQVLSDLESTAHDEEFFYRMQRTDYAASQLLRKNSRHADGLIIKTIANGYIARQQANREEWLSSINTARKALSSYDYLRELQPELPDLSLAEGLKAYYAAYLPDAYPIVKTVSWFLPEGNKQKGLELMHEAADNAIFARAEAIYFLANINYNYQKDYDKAVTFFKQLYLRYPNNNYYARKLVSSLFQLRRYDQALEIIDRSLMRWENKQLPFEQVLREEMLTWKGRILMLEGESEKARQLLSEAFALGKDLPRTSHRSFHVVAGYFLGSQLYSEGAHAEAKKILQQVLDCKIGEEYREKAKEILKEIS